MKKLARPIGFEPTTCSFGGCHSIQLSYGRAEVRILAVYSHPFRLNQIQGPTAERVMKPTATQKPQ